MQVWLKASKTDPFRQDVCIHIDKTNNALHPVTPLLNDPSVRDNTSGLLFHFHDHIKVSQPP